MQKSEAEFIKKVKMKFGQPSDTTILLDEFIKESTVRIRLEYVKRDVTNADITIKASMDFNAAPNTSK